LSDATPDGKTAGPRFRHIDDEEWREVRAQQHGARRVSVRQKWLEFSPRLVTLYTRYEPGLMLHKHGHNSDHAVFVLEGELMCGDVRCPAGTHITLEKGAAFGPLVAGPEGALLFEVFTGDTGSWPADAEGFERLLAEKGVEKLPDPPIELPAWLKTRREPQP
jgi:quercetin dioxygenase-like cupin family protein